MTVGKTLKGIGPMARGSILVALLALAALMNPVSGPLPANFDAPLLDQLLANQSAPDKSPQDALEEWVQNLQWSHGTATGAVLIHPSVAHRHDGVDYYRVLPYSSNQAVWGLLQSNPSAGIPVAEAWMEWVLAHSHDGRIVDHWITQDGNQTTCPPGQPTLCNHADADDSYAATFLWMADAYAQVAGPQGDAFLADRLDGLRAAGYLILSLQQDNGLTWARADYPVMYTMDNSEVYAGLAALGRIEARLGHNETWTASAETVAAALEAHLWDSERGRYALALHPNGQRDATDLLTWYPGTTPVAWPHLWGASSRGASQMDVVDQAWSFPRPDWHDQQVDATGFLWPSMGHAALVAGDEAGAQRHLNFVACQKMHPDAAQWFDWPFDAADAGWLLATMAAGLQPAAC